MPSIAPPSPRTPSQTRRRTRAAGRLPISLVAVLDDRIVGHVAFSPVTAMADEILLNEAAYAVWQTVKEKGPIELGEVVKLTGIDRLQVSAAATEASQTADMLKSAKVACRTICRSEGAATKSMQAAGNSRGDLQFKNWVKSAAKLQLAISSNGRKELVRAMTQ